MMKRMLGLSVIVALAAVFAVVGPVAAAPLIEGESLLTSTTGVAFIRIDWQVFSPADATAPLGSTPGLFQYVYQAEATVGTVVNGSPNDISSFTIAFVGPAFTAFGTIAGNLLEGSEINPVTGLALTCCTAPTNTPLSAGTATATFGSPVIPQGGQSTLLIGLSPFGPTGGFGTAVDGAPGSPWASTNPGGQLIPVPAPEPTTLMLLGLATGLAGFVTRKRK